MLLGEHVSDAMTLKMGGWGRPPVNDFVAGSAVVGFEVGKVEVTPNVTKATFIL